MTDAKQVAVGATPRNGSRASAAPRLIFIIVLAALVIGGGGYWWTTRGTESTEDAFTDGTAISTAPKVAGYVTKLAVTDNQRVKAGDVMLEIDPRDYQVARDRAAANLAVAEAQLSAAETALEIARVNYPANLASATAARDAAAATKARARADLARQQKVDVRATTQQQIDAALAEERTAAANLADSEAKLKVAGLVTQNIAAAEAQVKQLQGQVGQAKAALAQAELDLSNTKIVAPQDGWVTKRNVEQGTYVQPGQALFSLVSPDVWVTANFKESQLEYMRPGQKVRIDVDAYPQLRLSGHVASVQMGTGSKFTAFPAENATGNFVKIVQRVPVKILIDEGLDPQIPLPLGLSVEPVVTVK
jgi:membrane fusion protein (multidrug efflux system)